MDNLINQEIWSSEYELRQFIDKATRWKIDVLKKSSFITFENFVNNARENYDMFCNQLRDKLSNTQNWKAIEIDVIDRFIPMIENYKEWYKLNLDEINSIKDYNPYQIMLDVIKMTEKAIYKYFSGVDVFEHYKITGRTPFSIPSLYLFPFTTLTRDNFEESKLRYDIKLSEFKELVSKIENTNERTVIINDTYDKFIKLSERTNITNYKEYFIQLANIIKSQQVTKEDKPGKQYSVPDWCLAFYYFDVVGEQKGHKIERIESFIQKNNIDTSKGYFKKQYYEILRRINFSDYESLPPLPPEKIKNILPILKNNKEATKKAKGDIEYFTTEWSEYNDNH